MATKIKKSLSSRAIKICSDRNSLEGEFKKYGVSSKEERICLMLKAMGNPAVSYSKGYPDLKERYEVIIGSFLSGIWRQDFFRYRARRKSNDA